MAEIFISYARSTETEARKIAEALRALGYDVWRDDELPAHRAYGEVIAERLRAAKAVVVVWSADAVKSHWVLSEADRGRTDNKLVQLKVDGVALPMPFDQIQCADLTDWSGDLDTAGWRKVVDSVGELMEVAGHPVVKAARAPPPSARKRSVCVLPFANMSGDPEQEYFSDGVSEDIITDLSKVSALFVIARNTAFTFKGKNVDVPQIARQLGVGHVLEGSVRKAGDRVRITAQLIDAATGGHVWAERYDRDLTDIFALQDEISQSIVGALKLRLLPEEKQAIERRGTDNAAAYDLYLMARQHGASGNEGDPRRDELIIRLTRRATEIDPAYASAWTLMGRAQVSLRFAHGRREIDSWAAVEKALALDPALAEAQALKASHLRYEGRYDEALTQVEIALRLDPESYDVNRTAAFVLFNLRRFEDAIPYYRKAASLMETDIASPSMMTTCYTTLGDIASAREAARMTLSRAETTLAQDSGNGAALGLGVIALAVLGEAERARDWVRRALLVDPDNIVMHYNLACGLSAHLRDVDGALELLGPFLARCTDSYLAHAKADPDLDPIRDDSRFKMMIAGAEARLAAQAGPG